MNVENSTTFLASGSRDRQIHIFHLIDTASFPDKTSSFNNIDSILFHQAAVKSLNFTIKGKEIQLISADANKVLAIHKFN